MKIEALRELDKQDGTLRGNDGVQIATAESEASLKREVPQIYRAVATLQSKFKC